MRVAGVVLAVAGVAAALRQSADPKWSFNYRSKDWESTVSEDTPGALPIHWMAPLFRFAAGFSALSFAHTRIHLMLAHAVVVAIALKPQIS